MLKQMFFGVIDNDIYIQAGENQLKVVSIKSGREFNEPPYIAIQKDKHGKSIILAIGTEAKLLLNDPAYEVSNPFSHPRQLLADFSKAEKIVQFAIRKVMVKNFFATAPRIVFQPLDKLEGGLTDVESRAFRELCLASGAREVVIYLGTPLSISNFDFARIKVNAAK